MSSTLYNAKSDKQREAYSKGFVQSPPLTPPPPLALWPYGSGVHKHISELAPICITHARRVLYVCISMPCILAPSVYKFILFPYITICLLVHKVSCKPKENDKKYIIYNLLRRGARSSIHIIDPHF